MAWGGGVWPKSSGGGKNGTWEQEGTSGFLPPGCPPLLNEQQWGMGTFKLSRSGPGYPVGPCSSLANLKTHRHKPLISRVRVCDPARNWATIPCIILPVPRTPFSSSPHIRLWRKWSLGMWFRDWTRLMICHMSGCWWNHVEELMWWPELGILVIETDNVHQASQHLRVLMTSHMWVCQC